MDILELRNIPGPDLSKRLLSHFRTLGGAEEGRIEEKYDECLKYLYLSSLFYDKFAGKFIPVSPEVDEIWHYLILQTRDYQRLCMQLPGGIFLHHQSLPFTSWLGSGMDRQEIIAELLAWIPAYVKVFGNFTDKSGPYWQIVHYLHQELQMSYEAISALKLEGEVL